MPDINLAGATMTADPAAPKEPDRKSPASLPLLEVPLANYEMIGEQGRGGIGIVRRARDLRLDREVAIKELQRDSHRARQRFEREMRITAKLQHPGVVPVHEAGRWPDGSPFYTMKLVEGRSLKDLIAEKKTLDGRLALLPHVLAVAETIAYAHSRRIVHRDLKPSNVIVGAFGETVVIDWGLAKDLDDLTASPDANEGPYRLAPGEGLTVAGQVMGTPAYMPPEQARGGEVDEGADVYSIGAILYHLFAGCAPFSGTQSSDILRQLLAGPPMELSRLVPSLPRELVALTEKAISRDPAARYANAGALADDLRRFTAGQLVRAHDYGPAELALRWARRHKGVIRVAGLAALVIVALAFVAVTRVLHERTEAQRQRNIAELERDTTRRSRDRIIVVNAESSLARDPTAAIAWAKTYPHTGADWVAVSNVVREAIALGVSRAVKEQPATLLRHAVFLGASYFALTMTNDQVQIWDAKSGHIVASYPTGFPQAGILSSPSKPRAMFLADDDQLSVIDGVGGLPILRSVRTAGPVEKFTLSLDGSVLAYQLLDDSIWSLPLDAPLESPTHIMTTHDTHSIALSASGDSLFIGAASGLITTISSKTGKLESSNRVRIDIRKLHAFENDAHIGILATDGSAYAMDRSSGQLQKVNEGGPRSSTFAVGGGFIAFTNEGRVGTWTKDRDIQTGLDGFSTTAVAAVASLSYVVAGTESGDVIVWSMQDPRRSRLMGHSSRVEVVAISQDGSLILSGSRDGQVRFWPMAQSTAHVVATGPQQVYDVVEANGEVAVSWCGGRSVVLATDRHSQLDMASEYPTCFNLAISSDGARVAAGTHRGDVVEFDVGTRERRKLVVRGNGEWDDVIALAYSSAGHWLAVGYASGVVRLFENGVPRDIYDFGARVVAAEFGSSENRLVVIDESGLVHVVEPGVQSTKAHRLDATPSRLAVYDGIAYIGTTDGGVFAVDTKSLESHLVHRRASRVERILKQGKEIIVLYRDGHVAFMSADASSVRISTVCREAVGDMALYGVRGVVILCRDGLLKVVEPETLLMSVQKVANDATALAVMRGGGRIYTGDMEGNVAIWNARVPVVSVKTVFEEADAATSVTMDVSVRGETQ